MILVFPEIVLSEGICNFTIHGEKSMDEIYAYLSTHPDLLSQLMRRENAKTLHISCCDKLFSNKSSNLNTIIAISKSIEIPIQLYAKFQDRNDIEFLLENGISRIICDDIIVEQPEVFERLMDKYSNSRIAANIVTYSGKIKLGNYFFGFDDVNRLLKELNISRVVFSDDRWLKNKEFDKEYLLDFCKSHNYKITIGEGITQPKDLWEISKLQDYGVDSVILGKPLFENNFPCQEIWRLIESKLEPDISKNFCNLQE